MKKKVRNWFVVSIFLLTIVAAANAKTIYVDADVSPGGGGTNWSDAYKYLQDALADANVSARPVEIHVAQGTYRPDEGAGVTDGDRTATFQLINGVTLKGGYAGDGEPDPNARDVASYETILSGDLDGNDVPVGDPCDLLSHPTRAENSYHVLTVTDTDETAVLDGFTITAGNANGSVYPDDSGAGMYGGSPTVLNCTFSNNSAYGRGGAMYTWGAVGSTISNCTFVENSAEDGGGIGGGNMRLTNCTFSGNLGVGSGGGMWIIGAPILTNCVFNSNAVRGFSVGGGGMYIVGTSNPILINCTFNGNLADGDYGFGGGVSMQVYEDTTQTFMNCTFSGNSASKDGAGFCTGHCYATFTNCTFSENLAGRDGGAFCCYANGGTADLNNCIFWGNTAYGEGPQIAAKTSAMGWTITVSYCDVQGGKWDIYDPSGYLVWDDVNNINSDPCFVDADGADDTAGTEDDNLRLTNGSPCIDAGDNTAVPADTADLDGDLNTVEPTPVDLNGFPRFIDDLCTVDTGNGTPLVVDMGAYEFFRSDIDSNGSVDFEDYCVIADRWPETSCGLCGGADLTCDGNVDWNDVRELAAHWLCGQ
ncbi:MAG: right-handed parallel beta-helix repeat-containing protein [Planctomycetota bacterium]